MLSDDDLTAIATSIDRWQANHLTLEDAAQAIAQQLLSVIRPRIIEQDILDVTSGVICHQVNLKGKMGAGLALAIRQKWPIVFEKYKAMCDRGLFQLGSIQPVQVSETLWVCNLAGQEGYGRGQQQTDYDAVRTGLEKLNKWASDRSLQVYLPHGMGCGLAGGDWSVIEQIIKETVPSALICRKGDR